MMSHPLAVQGAAAPFLAPNGVSDRQGLLRAFQSAYKTLARGLMEPLLDIDVMIARGFPLEVHGKPTMAMKRFRAREYLREASKRHPEWNVRRAAP